VSAHQADKRHRVQPSLVITTSTRSIASHTIEAWLYTIYVVHFCSRPLSTPAGVYANVQHWHSPFSCLLD
jgi:hypothetical protein